MRHATPELGLELRHVPLRTIPRPPSTLRARRRKAELPFDTSGFEPDPPVPDDFDA